MQGKIRNEGSSNEKNKNDTVFWPYLSTLVCTQTLMVCVPDCFADRKSKTFITKIVKVGTLNKKK